MNTLYKIYQLNPQSPRFAVFILLDSSQGLCKGSIETESYALKDFKNRSAFATLGEVVGCLAENGIEESVMALHSELMGE